MGLFDSVFFPKKKKNIFNTKRYLQDLESGIFRNKFNLGIQALNGGSWRLKDFTKEPNAVFGGQMGSGKSKATLFTISTWMYANSDQTVLFITDSLKGAEDYRSLFKYPQVYTGFDEEKIHKIVDLLFDEIKSRKKLFAEVKAESITQYDKKVGAYNRENPHDKKPAKMARVILLMEEFHAVPYQIMNFSADFKKEMTTASKFHQIMRVGRSYGVWVLACSQKMTSSDIPPEVVPNLTQKQIFKVSKGESGYFLSNADAANLTTDQKGRCITEEGPVQFPLLPDKTQELLLEKYMKDLEAGCAYLSPQLIQDYLAGTSTEELYKFKNLVELVTGIKNFEDKVIIGLLHKRMGHRVEEPDKGDSFGLSWIVHWPAEGDRPERKVAVMNRIGNKSGSNSKVTSKHIGRLARAMEKYRCTHGIIYTSEVNLPKGLYGEAQEAVIEVVDHEDLIGLAKKIENSEVKTFDPTKLADDDKESGDYQDRKEKEKAVDVWDEKLEEEARIKKEAQQMAKDLVDQMELYPDIDDEELKNPEFDFPEDMEVPEWLEADDPHDYPEDFDEVSDEPNEIYEEENFENEGDPSFDDDNSEFADILMGERARTKAQKRIPVRSTFNLKAEEAPSLIFHLKRNEKGEVYRCLFAVSVNSKVKHKFYLDRKVSGEFSVRDLRRLGITSVGQWNEQPEVLNDQEFSEKFIEYLNNFNVLEFPAKSYCWEKDKDFLTKYMNNSKIEIPTTMEYHMETEYQFSEKELTREFLIQQFQVSGVKDDMFEEISEDLELYHSIF